jgi:hypothetical protein
MMPPGSIASPLVADTAPRGALRSVWVMPVRLSFVIGAS